MTKSSKIVRFLRYEREISQIATGPLATYRNGRRKANGTQWLAKKEKERRKDRDVEMQKNSREKDKNVKEERIRSRRKGNIVRKLGKRIRSRRNSIR